MERSEDFLPVSLEPPRVRETRVARAARREIEKSLVRGAGFDADRNEAARERLQARQKAAQQVGDMVLSDQSEHPEE